MPRHTASERFKNTQKKKKPSTIDQIKDRLRKGIGLFGKLARGGKRPGKSSQ